MRCLRRMFSKVSTKTDCKVPNNFFQYFAMYNQELSRDRVTPSYQRLRNMVRQHIDQSIRTRNFKARNERIETGVLVKSLTGKMSALKEKWETAFNGRRTDNVQEETTVVLTTGLILVNEHNHPLQLRERRHRLTEERLTHGNPRGVSPSGLKGKRPCKNFFGGTCTEPSCHFWHLLCA